MTLHYQMRPLLAQFTNATGRGNLVVANETLVQIVEKLIERLDQPPPPCNCQCGSKVVTLPSLPVPLSEPPLTPVEPAVDREPENLIADDMVADDDPEPMTTKPAAKPRARRKSPAKTTRRKPRTVVK